METKKPWQSKTMLVNGVLGLAAFVSLFLPQGAVVSTWISGHGAELALGWSALNMILRAVTKDRVKLVD